MIRSTLVFAVMALAGMTCLTGCGTQSQSGAVSPQPVAYSLNTPVLIIKADQRGEAILMRDVPEVLVQQKYQLSGLDSLMDVETLSGAIIPLRQLAQVQVDLAQLSAAERPAQAATSYLPPPIYTTSFICEDSNTPVQNTVCGNPELASLDVQTGALFRQLLGGGDVFERDQLLASQRAWLLGLAASCGVTGAPSNATGAGSISCLESAYQARVAVLTDWPAPRLSVADPLGAAIAKYVSYKLLDARQPSLCKDIGGQAAVALADDGAIDPARLDGAQEIAGSHGTASAANPQGGMIAVDLYRAGLYGGYQKRARALTVSGASAPLIGPETLGNYVQTLPNGGGRYVSFPSQTGDYGAIDVFAYRGELLALVTDTTGYDSPAPPGEAAVAGLFTITQNTAAPTCLFETFLMPPPIAMGTFADQPSLSPFLALIDTIHGDAPAALAPSDRQDTSYLSGETRWMMLNMPLVILAQAESANWAGWLRYRHDQVLDALFAWSQQSPSNQAAFNKVFDLLRPAATDLDTIYVQQQGLTTDQAEQATSLAMMELLYQSTTYFAPGLGSGPADPGDYKSYKPRYPILANPQ